MQLNTTSPIPLPKIRLYDCLYYIDNDDPKTASLFFANDLIDLAKSEPFLKYYLEKVTKTNQTRNFRWKLNCLLSDFLNSQNQIPENLSFAFQSDIELEFIDDFFKTSKDQIVTFISPFLNGKKVTKQNEIHNLSFYSLLFSESYPGVYDCIYPKFKKLLYDVITLPKLYEILSTDFLYLFKEPPTDFVKSLPIDLIDTPMFFKATINYTHPEFSIMLQNRFSLQVQYPAVFPQILNGDFFSLVNTSLVSEEHLFDIISHSVLENMTLGEFNEIVQRDFLSFEPNDVNRVIPYLLISFQQLLYADLPNAIPILIDFINRNKRNISSPLTNVSTLMSKNSSGSNLTSFVGNLKKTLNMNSEEAFFSNNNAIYKNNFDMAIDLLKRFRNDQSLATLITNISKIETNVNDLSNFSIPKHFASFLARKDILTQLSEMNFYLISDKDKSTDLDFIRAFHAMTIFLHNFPTPPVSKQSLIKTQFEFTYDMANFLKDMTNDEMKKALCLDIFSILFMRKSNGQFVVTIQYAKSVLSMLSQFTDSKYILNGLAKVSKVNTKLNNDFNSLFIQDPKDFFNAMESGKFQVAYECAKNENLTKFFLLAYSIHLIILKTHIPIDAAEYMDLLNFEFCLSFDNHGIVLFGQESDAKAKFLNMIGISPEATVLDIPSIPFDVRDEFNDTIKEFSEKTGIPQKKIEYILNERSTSNSFYINNRSINDETVSPFDDYEVRTSLTTFAKDFNAYVLNEMRLPDYVQKSKSLTSFCAYLICYYNYCMLCPYINPDTIYDSFNIFLPLRGILESGNIEKAEEFCQFVHADLFQFVIEHLSDFTLNQDFYDFYKSKYSLEIHTIQLTDQLNEKSRYEIEEKELSEDRVMYSIINKIKNNEKVDYDDIGFYNVDHQRLYKLFITSNIDKIARYDTNRNYDQYYNTTSINAHQKEIEFNDETINFMKMIDYIAPESDLEMIENIYFDHIKYSHQLYNDKSIIKYYLDNKEYEKAFNIVNQSESRSELFECLLDIHDEVYVNQLFIQFKDNNFIELANEYCHDENNMKFINKYATNDQKDIISSYISLPQVIRENCKIFDQQSIIDAFIHNPEQIISINETHKAILTDFIKLQILTNFCDLIIFNTYATHLYHLFDNKNSIDEKLNQIHNHWIQNITVDSIEKEEEALKGIISIRNVYQFIDSNEMSSKIDAISLFLKYRLFLTYGIKYSFKLFNENDQLLSDYLLSIAFNYDLDEIANIIGQSFHSDYDNIILHRIKQQIQLGLIKPARLTIQNYESKKSTQGNQYSVFVDKYHEFMNLSDHSNYQSDLDEYSNVKYFLKINLEHPFYSLFLHHSIFDTEFILSSFYPNNINSMISTKIVESNELNQENLIKYSNLSYSSSKYITQIINTKTNIDLLSELKFYAIRHSSTPSALIILNSTEQYDTSYQLLMSIPDERRRSECFVYHFYPASFFYQSSKPKLVKQTMPRPESTEKLAQLANDQPQTKKEAKKFSIASFFSKKTETQNDNSQNDFDFEALKASLDSEQEYVGPNDDMTKILKFLGSQDPESILTPALFDALATFLEGRNINSILSQLYFYQHKLEDSALASIKSFASSAHKQYFINNAKSYLARTILMRYHKIPIPKNSSGVELPVFSNKLDNQSIKTLKANVDLQSDILNYFVQKNLKFDEDYDILNNNESGASNCCAFFLLHLLFDMYERIRKMLEPQINNKTILKKLAKELAKQKEKEIIQILNQLAAKYPPIKNELISSLLKELSMTENWLAISPLIMMIPDPYQQLAYFIEYDFLFEAYGVILNNIHNPQIKNLIPYWIHRAAILGQIELIDQISP